MKKLLSLRIDLGSFERRGAINRFAVMMSLRSVILSLMASAMLFLVLHHFALLPLTLSQASWLAVTVSWSVGATVSGILSLATGRAIYELSLARAEFERLSRTDMLSGLFNRRAFSEILGSTDDNASLVIFDVDRFKLVNDQFGHSAGDAVIRTVSSIISGVFLEGCTVARLGGEEFGVIIEGGCLQARLDLVELARQRIADRTAAEGDDPISVTISAGVADIWPGRSADSVYSSADKALYLAKAAGRNRVVHEREGLELSGYGVQTESHPPESALKNRYDSGPA